MELFLPIPSVCVYKNTMNNQKLWYQEKKQPTNEREQYCSHNLPDIKFNVFVRKDCKWVSFLEALQLSFCTLTWSFFILMSFPGTCIVILTHTNRQPQIDTRPMIRCVLKPICYSEITVIFLYASILYYLFCMQCISTNPLYHCISAMFNTLSKYHPGVSRDN